MARTKTCVKRVRKRKSPQPDHEVNWKIEFDVIINYMKKSTKLVATMDTVVLEFERCDPDRVMMYHAAGAAVFTADNMAKIVLAVVEETGLDDVGCLFGTLCVRFPKPEGSVLVLEQELRAHRVDYRSFALKVLAKYNELPDPDV